MTKRKVCIRLALSLREGEDADVIEFLDLIGKGNISPYLRKLVRADMKKQKKQEVVSP